MVVSNALFDALLFGALLLGIGLDYVIPGLHGAGFVVACGLAVNMAAIEFSDWLHERRLWTQEPLATAIALSTGGFIYFNWANESDFILLLLSIGLMMGSLMLTIATVAMIGSTFTTRSAGPLTGYLTTIGGSVIIGALAGLLSLDAPVATKAGAVLAGFMLWKVREKVAPPKIADPSSDTVEAPVASATEVALDAADHLGQLAANVAKASAVSVATMGLLSTELSSNTLTRWQLIPKRGRLLDRFLPLLILGGLLFISTQKPEKLMQSVAPPASANNGNAAHP